jgi:hypothetical protein
MALELYFILVRSDNHTERRMPRYHTVTWLSAALSTAVLAATHSFGHTGDDGQAGPWCWVKSGNWMTRFIPFYLPLSLLW